MSKANHRSELLFATFVIIVVLGFPFAAFGEDAATTFKAKCAMCHGADASGNTAMGKKFNIPDLRAPETQKKSKAELATVIAKGKNKMPAFEGKVSADEVGELATYVRQLKK